MGFDPMCVTTKRVLKKLGGDKISGAVFTFDGNPEGKPKNGLYVKISDKRPDWSTFVKVKGIMYGQSVELTVSDLKVIHSGVGTYFTYQDIPIVMIVYLEKSGSITSDVPLGLYVLCDPDTNSYVSYVEFAETIHPIEPKYLPGVCLPVVELTTMIPVLESSDSGSEASLSDVENNALNNAVGLPCVIKCSVGGTLATGVFTYLLTDTKQSYMFTFASLVVNIHKYVDVWGAYAVLA